MWNNLHLLRVIETNLITFIIVTSTFMMREAIMIHGQFTILVSFNKAILALDFLKLLVSIIEYIHDHLSCFWWSSWRWKSMWIYWDHCIFNFSCSLSQLHQLVKRSYGGKVNLLTSWNVSSSFYYVYNNVASNDIA